VDFQFLRKPKTEEEFKRPVSWLVGRDLIAGMKWIALYTAFKGKLDPRDWMKPRVYPYKDKDQCMKFWRRRSDRAWQWKVANDSFWQAYNAKTQNADPQAPFWRSNEGTDQEEFWFDYIADSGDGQMAMYNVAYLCLNDMWADGSVATDNPSPPASSDEAEVRFETSDRHNTLLPRGQFLFVGGDTAYHISDYSTLSERFQHPFRWAFSSLRGFLGEKNRLNATPTEDGNIPLLDAQGNKLRWDTEPARPIFAVPGNHDYYDVIDGFNRQFRRPATPEHGRKLAPPQLSIPGFERYQESSYVALHLPFDWWFLGLDTEVSELDVRQQVFFFDLKDPVTGQLPDKLIIATPEPTTVFRRCKPEDDKTLQAFKQLGLGRQFLTCDPPETVVPPKIRLDLSGDVHHYARYYGPNTKQLADSRLHADNYASVVAGGGGAFHHPTTTKVDKGVEEQTIYPPPDISRNAVAPKVFDLRNIWHGGYVWLFGMIVAWVVYFAATVPRTSKEVVDWFFSALKLPFVPDSSFPMSWYAVQGYTGAYQPGEYWLSTALLVLAFAPLIWAILRFNKIIQQLITVPVVIDWDAEPPSLDQLPILYRDLIPIGVATFASLGLFLSGVWQYAVDVQDPGLHPFSCSLLILYHLALASALVVLSVQNSEWLTHRVKFVMGTKYDYVPLSIVASIALLIALFGVWVFGYYPSAYVLSDIIFALVALGLLLALIGVGYSVGGKLQRLPGKILMALTGLWHAVLQLAAPLLLVRIGDWKAIGLALVAVAIFSGISIPWTRISIPGIGVWLMRWKSPAARWLLTAAWVVFGAVILLLPAWFHERSNVVTVVGFETQYYSSFLPQSWMDSIQHFYASNNHNPLWFVSTIMIISLAMAVVLGFLLSMAWLSWYFAVALGFNGHNNEVGGAARIEEYKHIVRIRLRNRDLTAFVIAFDKPEAEGKNLKPKLVDVFQLRG
jgi:hypothetical protein